MKNEPSTENLLIQTHELLLSEGYRLIDDAWNDFGRRAYKHDDGADRNHIKRLAKLLQRGDWQIDPRKLRTFRLPGFCHEIELEPGGSEVTGHFLHHMRPKLSTNNNSSAR